MNFDLPSFYRDSVKGPTCSLCSYPAVTHVTTQGIFQGCWMHCSNHKCDQSYNAERQRKHAQIKELEDKIESLRLEMMGEDL